MNVQKMICDLKERALDEGFISLLKEEYAAESDSYLTETEGDYQKAVLAFSKASEDVSVLLFEKDTLSEANLRYAVGYGFSCGLFAGFRQCFTPSATGEEDFSLLVEDGLFTIPGMRRHGRFIQNKDRFNEITLILEDTIGEDLKEHLVSIDCALEERVHYAAAMSFYSGYRVALDTIGQISLPLELGMVHKQLMTEYTLGLIGTYDQTRAKQLG